jgi:probable HAF family extracellular repeat protein
MMPLGDLSGEPFASQAHAISQQGQIIVGRGNSGFREEAFRWTESTGMEGLGDLTGSGSSIALGISRNGLVIVGESDTPRGEKEAFRWTATEGMIGLGDLDGGRFRSTAHDVALDGAVIVGEGHSQNGREAFLWRLGEGFTSLGDLPGGNFESFALAVSADGHVIVGESISALGEEAFVWTSQSGMLGLGDLPGGLFQSRAYDVSDRGTIIVGRGMTGIGEEAFMWDIKNGMRRLQDVLETDFGLDLTGWLLREARAISADGTVIVGIGIYGGTFQAWMAQLPTSDSDNDGIPDDKDECLDSDLSPTVVIDGCNSGVANHLFDNGCAMSDLIGECADRASNHGQFVGCVAKLTNTWKKEGLISGREQGRIQRCAAQANIP